MRIRNVPASGFEGRLQESEAHGSHATETIGYVAIERGDESRSGGLFVAGRTSNTVNGMGGSADRKGDPYWHSVSLPTSAESEAFEGYVVLAQQQMYDGGNTAGLRMRRAMGADLSLKHWNILAPSGTVIGRVEDGGGRRYYLKDHLGSVRAVLDGSGSVKETRDYYPFGLPMAGRYERSSPPTKQDFTGHPRDVETQLHYAGARYYSAAFGRWTTTDPILGQKGPKALLEQDARLLSMSAYNYTYDNPVNLKDADGRCPDCVVDLGFVAYDLYDIGSSIASGEGVSGTQLAALGGDLAGLAVPFATGGGSAARAALKADDIADAAKTLESADDAGKLVTNPVPDRMARAVPAEFADAKRLGPEGAEEAFVTGASDVSDVSSARELAEKLTLVDESGDVIPGSRAIIEFDAPKKGVASPVFRKNPGFVGGGRTAGGAREFVIPNFRISDLDNVTIRIVE